MTDIPIVDIALGTLSHDFFRYLIGAGGVYVLVNSGLAGWIAARKIRRKTPDLAQVGREILASLRTVLIFASFGTGITLAAIAGWLEVYSHIGEYGWIWFVASTLLIIVAHDAYFYWAHWLMHRVRVFRRIHMLHHRSHNPTAFTSYSFDAAEAAVHATFLPLFLLIFPMHPAALLIFTSHMMLRNAIGHCGYELFPADRRGRPLFDWMTTVTHHDLHHGQAGTNFSLYFTWWDRWMGTENPRYHQVFAEVVGRRANAEAGAVRADGRA
ncbi:MAG: sterol desaturase family protein [Pseudomonadota bacterium]